MSEIAAILIPALALPAIWQIARWQERRWYRRNVEPLLAQMSAIPSRSPSPERETPDE